MIWLTIPQAAARVDRRVDTIRRWIGAGDLTAVRNPIDRQRYVRETDLLDVERAKRAAARATRTVAHQEGLWVAGDQWLDRLDLVAEDERTGDVFASTERGGAGPTSWEGDYELPALPRYSIGCARHASSDQEAS